MQFHLNGFRPGDPTITPATVTEQTDGMPAEVDVLIVGSGPAGLTLAAQLSAFPDITTRLIEAKAGPMEKGQADGVSCRSMEMFEAFGFAEEGGQLFRLSSDDVVQVVGNATGQCEQLVAVLPQDAGH